MTGVGYDRSGEGKYGIAGVDRDLGIMGRSRDNGDNRG